MLQLIIPALNEAARLPGTLAQLNAFLSQDTRSGLAVEVIVVDNASTDATAQVAREASTLRVPVRVVDCPTRGKGAAVRAGVAVTDADLVGFMDADGATALEALDEANRLIACGAQVAIASRAVDGSHTIVRHSALRSRGADVYRSLAARIVPGVLDTQCGFKLMNGDLARAVFASVRTDGFSFDVELLARLQWQGASIAEFPALWVDVPGSTFSPIRHGASSFADLARISWMTRELRRAGRGRATIHALPTPALGPELEAAGEA